MPKLLDENAQYTFRSYLELPNDADEVLAEFGYSDTQARLNLPKPSQALTGLAQLKAQISAQGSNRRNASLYTAHHTAHQ